MKKDISDLDKNLKVVSDIDEEDIAFYDIWKPPFKVYGVIEDDGIVRMKKTVAEKVSEGVRLLNCQTSGGRMRFKTDSEYIALKVEAENTGLMHHMSLLASSGFDMYERENGEYSYNVSFFPDIDLKRFSERKGYEYVVHFNEKKMRDVMFHFPLYNDVKKMYVGLQEDAALEEGTEYKNKKPIVFYGSSITQGGCASRPGLSYANIISRRFDIDIINLGFSGNGKGEPEIAEYISNLDMSVFVYDYDYNAPDAEHLKNTHKAMFDVIRKKNPDLPIIMMSRPKLKLNDDELKRKEIIYDTYRNAIENGDKNVYFIPGDEMFKPIDFDDCTVDGIHPNDLGFKCMADAVSEKLDIILKN